MKLEALARQKMDTVTVEALTNPAPGLLGTEVGIAGLSGAFMSMNQSFSALSWQLVFVLLHSLC